MAGLGYNLLFSVPFTPNLKLLPHFCNIFLSFSKDYISLSNGFYRSIIFFYRFSDCFYRFRLVFLISFFRGWIVRGWIGTSSTLPFYSTCMGGVWECTEAACGSRCSSVGDPHYTTFDGKSYDFMGKCSYFLVRGDNFSVQAENVPCAGAVSEVSVFFFIVFKKFLSYILRTLFW